MAIIFISLIITVQSAFTALYSGDYAAAPVKLRSFDSINISRSAIAQLDTIVGYNRRSHNPRSGLSARAHSESTNSASILLSVITPQQLNYLYTDFIFRVICSAPTRQCSVADISAIGNNQELKAAFENFVKYLRPAIRRFPDRDNSDSVEPQFRKLFMALVAQDTAGSTAAVNEVTGKQNELIMLISEKMAIFLGRDHLYSHYSGLIEAIDNLHQVFDKIVQKTPVDAIKNINNIFMLQPYVSKV
ncbi:hypothetical protein FBU30_009311 [Linnemannia zychae]|nr:hypothetical protein FBU30_009311 [Linnemannia zychae]